MGDLLAIGNSNWDYVLTDSNYVRSIAKPGSGASDSSYGDLNYFRKAYRNGWIGSLTDLGEKIIYKIK
jgi:hypothetical protein